MPMSRREVLGLVSFAVLGSLCPASACGGYGDLAILVARSKSSARGSQFLCQTQDRDGAWRSSHYGFFRGGDALTPLALTALLDSAQTPTVQQAMRSGGVWMDQFTDRIATLKEPWTELRYPLFTASYAARYYARLADPVRAKIWADLIIALQHSAQLGWAKDDPRHGAWSDTSMPPRKPAGEAVPDMVNPNISATAMAVLGLISAGRIEEARNAVPFIEKCQNWRADHREAAFDDGGFFFALEDPARNKAGVAGKDARGRERYRSYGSATCDGVLALLALGKSADDPRVDAALRWLRGFPAGLPHPAQWPADRADSGRALLYYYAQALAEVLRRQGGQAWTLKSRRNLWRGLNQEQGTEGSWSNADAESCEDDPIVATAFALHAFKPNDVKV